MLRDNDIKMSFNRNHLCLTCRNIATLFAWILGSITAGGTDRPQENSSSCK